MLDASLCNSSSDFAKVKSFLSQLVSRLDIDSGSTRVGLLTYEMFDPFRGYAPNRFTLRDYSSTALVQSAISRLNYSRVTPHYTTGGFFNVRRLSLTSSNGDRSNVPNVVVVLPNGRSISTATWAQVCSVLRLLQKNFHISAQGLRNSRREKRVIQICSIITNSAACYFWIKPSGSMLKLRKNDSYFAHASPNFTCCQRSASIIDLCRLWGGLFSKRSNISKPKT